MMTWTISELEKFTLQGGVSQTMSEIPCPRAESAPQALAYTHTPYHWLLAKAGLYFSPQDGWMQIHGQTNISAADKHGPLNLIALKHGTLNLVVKSALSF